MAKKITKLTPEQEARFPEFVKKWVDIGLSTEPADFDAATEAALKAYALCNLKKPMVVLRMGSPYAATVGGAMAWLMLKNVFKDQVRDQVWAQVRAQVRDQVWDQVGDQVRDQVRQQSSQAAKDGVNNYGINQMWCGFDAYVDFLRDVCGWDGDTLPAFEINEAIVKSCGWTWWHQNVLSISDRPIEINRDAEGRLHAENKPSMLYRDGWSLYHWHGVAIPGEWVMGKPPTASEALHWPNIEQRRAACEIVGWKNILKGLDAKVIDADGDEEIGTLLEVDIPDSGKERFLKVMCGTKREFVIPVPREMQTAIEGNAWTYGLSAKDMKIEVRT